MNHPNLDLMVQSERRKDEMAAAAHYRLVKTVERSTRLHRTPPRLPVYALVVLLARGMAWLGRRLTVWSCRLQQYTAAPVMNLPAEEQPAPCA